MNTPDSHRIRAIDHRKAGRLDESLAELQKALRLDPDYAPAYYNIALVHMDRHRPDEAAAAWRKAIQIRPDYHQAWSSLGSALRHLGKLNDSIAACRQAIRIKPDSVDAHLNLATALHAAWKMDEAAAEFEQTLRLDSRNVSALNNYANLLQDNDQPGRAAELYRRAINLAPNRAELYNNLGNVLKIQADVDGAIACYRKTLSMKPDSWHVHSNLLLTLNCHPRADSGLLSEHIEWAERHAARFYPRQGVGPVPDRAADRRLRIGYISPDLRRHSVACFLEPLLAQHNNAEFEVFCYSDVVRPDDMTQRLRSHANHWRPIAGIADERVVQLIREEDRIDILVDLAGHTAHHRLLVFARKPAPVQVSYLGYPNTTGMAAMDFRMTDAEADPVGLTEAHHVERLIRLPRGFHCYRPPEEAPPPRDDRGAAKGSHITFGTFNNFAKVTPEMIGAWSRLLLEVSESSLLIKAECLADEVARRRVHGMFESHGVSPARVELLGRVPSFRGHLATYHRIDVALDTFPYHGTTTTCEAMWMGVPVVTLAGRAHVSRVGVSLLTRVGVPELIAQSADDYVTIASQLARDHDRRRELSSSLRRRMRESALTDAKGFAQSVEDAYRAMWHTMSRS